MDGVFSMFKLDKIMTNSLIMIILFIVYSLIVLLIFHDKNLVFCSAYIFTVIAFIIGILLNKKLFNEETKSTFNSLPLAMFSFGYLVLQAVLSFILMLFSSFILLEISITIQVIILAIFLIVAILLFKSRDYIDDLEEKTEAQISFIKNLQKEVDILYTNYNKPEYGDELFELKEKVRYSNPMGNNDIKELEEEILKNINKLKVELTNNNQTQIFDLINLLKNNLNEREVKLKK
jgi:hypothetical protein